MCTVPEMNSLSRLEQWIGGLSVTWQAVLLILPFLAVRLVLPNLFPADASSLVSIFAVVALVIGMTCLGFVGIDRLLDQTD